MDWGRKARWRRGDGLMRGRSCVQPGAAMPWKWQNTRIPIKEGSSWIPIPPYPGDPIILDACSHTTPPTGFPVRPIRKSRFRSQSLATRARIPGEAAKTGTYNYVYAGRGMPRAGVQARYDVPHPHPAWRNVVARAGPVAHVRRQKAEVSCKDPGKWRPARESRLSFCYVAQLPRRGNETC